MFGGKSFLLLFLLFYLKWIVLVDWVFMLMVCISWFDLLVMWSVRFLIGVFVIVEFLVMLLLLKLIVFDFNSVCLLIKVEVCNVEFDVIDVVSVLNFEFKFEIFLVMVKLVIWVIIWLLLVGLFGFWNDNCCVKSEKKFFCVKVLFFFFGLFWLFC